MNISEITKAKQVKARDPVKKARGIQKSHPYKGKLVGESDALGEAPLVLSSSSDLMNMLDSLLQGWKKKEHSDAEVEELLKALGYKIDKKGDRTVLVQEGPIGKALSAVALIAGLWGVNGHLAQKAYDASPQLQKLTAYLEVAKQHNDQRMIDQLEQRIENHKARIDLGKGEVLDKDGNPVKVVYDKQKTESTGIPFDKCPQCGGEIFHESEGKKDACYHKVKSRYKVWPSAYASGALVQCRKVGAKNWGNKSKKK